MATERMTLERWEHSMHVPLMVASFGWLVGYSWQVIGDVHGPGITVTGVVIAVAWLVFIVDYGARLWLARPRARWFWHHLWDLAVVVLPTLRALRVLRMLTIAASFQRSAGTALRSQIAIYGAGAAVLLMYVGALAELDAERHAVGANIMTFGDSLWWAFVTLATVGYGDFYPVTFPGRLVAAGLMAAGIAVVGVVTATAASWLIERVSAGRDDDEPATRGQVRALSLQLAELATPPSNTGDNGNGP